MNPRTIKILVTAALVVIVVAGAIYMLVPTRAKDEQVIRRTMADFSRTLAGMQRTGPLIASDRSSLARDVTPELLATWEKDPQLMPARIAGEKPDHIVVDSVEPQAQSYVVTGSIVLATSTDGTAGRIPFLSQVVRRSGEWLIAGFQEQVAGS